MHHLVGPPFQCSLVQHMLFMPCNKMLFDYIIENGSIVVEHENGWRFTVSFAVAKPALSWWDWWTMVETPVFLEILHWERWKRCVARWSSLPCSIRDLLVFSRTEAVWCGHCLTLQAAYSVSGRSISTLRGFEKSLLVFTTRLEVIPGFKIVFVWIVH